MSDFIEIRKLIRTLLRKWWLIAMVTLCAGALGYLYSKSQTPIYRATATLIIGPSMQSPDLNRSQIQTSQELGLTYANVAKRFPVLEGTVKALGLDMDWRMLRNNLDVSLVGNTQLLEITATAPSPALAAALADEVANQLILFSPTGFNAQRNADTQIFVEERLSALQQKIEDGEKRLSQLENFDVTALPAENILRTQEEIVALEKLITDWEANYSTLLRSLQTSNEATNYLEVLEPAFPNLSPVRPRTLLNVLVATIAGAIFSIGLAIAFENLDKTVRSAAEVQNKLDAPLIGNIGQMAAVNKVNHLLTDLGAYSPIAEDYRLLRSKLIRKKPEKVQKSFLVASPGHRQGAEIAAANLGIVMAQAGIETIVVDANLRHPNQHTLFGIENDRGLINLLCYPEISVDGLLKRCGFVPNLQILNAGVLWADQRQSRGMLSQPPTELLGTSAMQKILKDLQDRADIVIFAGAPLIPFADSIMLSTMVDGAVVIVELNRTHHSEVEEALRHLHQSNAPVAGIVTKRARGWSARLRNLLPRLRKQSKDETNRSGGRPAIEAKSSG